VDPPYRSFGIEVANVFAEDASQMQTLRYQGCSRFYVTATITTLAMLTAGKGPIIAAGSSLPGSSCS